MASKKSPIINLRQMEFFNQTNLIMMGNVLKELDELIILIQSLKSQNKEQDAIKDALYNYFIIKLVTTIEQTLKLVVQQIVDELNPSIHGLFSDDQIHISLSNLEEIKNLTRGKIISTSFNFQNVSEINAVMSKLIDRDFFKTIQDILKPLTSHKEFGEYYKTTLDKWNDFLNIFAVRNKIVHSIKVSHKLDFSYVIDMYTCTSMFLAITVGILNTMQGIRKGEFRGLDFTSALEKQMAS